MQEEIWKDVVGYEEYFMVSESGRIFSKRTNKILKLIKGKTGGYLQFSTRLHGRKSKAKMFKVHVLVCEAFNGPMPNEIQKYALHWDDNKENNHYTNLRWGSLSENVRDSIRNGTFRTLKLEGEQNGSSILKEKDVLNIYFGFNLLPFIKREDRIAYLMQMYDVSRGTIRSIIEGRAWKHLTNGRKVG